MCCRRPSLWKITSISASTTPATAGCRSPIRRSIRPKAARRATTSGSSWNSCAASIRNTPRAWAYTKELKTRKEWQAFWDKQIVDKAWAGFIAKKNAAKPGEGDRIAREVEEKGYAQTAWKVYDQVPYKRPFTTPTGKAEIVSFYVLTMPSAKGIQPIPEHYTTKAYTHPKPLSDEFIIVSGKDGATNAGVTLFTWPTKFLGDRTLWINPVDAERLGIKTGDTVEVEGLDNHVKGRTKVTVTNRVMAGVLFSHGFSGGVRTKNLPPESSGCAKASTHTGSRRATRRSPAGTWPTTFPCASSASDGGHS